MCGIDRCVSGNATGQVSSATGVYSQATGENSRALCGLLGLWTDNPGRCRLTQATAARAIAVGNAAQVHADEGVALGVKTRVLAGADRAVAIGSDSVASEADTVSFGHLATDEDEFTGGTYRSEEHTSELQSLMRISYAVFCLKKKIQQNNK